MSTRYLRPINHSFHHGQIMASLPKILTYQSRMVSSSYFLTRRAKLKSTEAMPSTSNIDNNQNALMNNTSCTSSSEPHPHSILSPSNLASASPPTSALGLPPPDSPSDSDNDEPERNRPYPCPDPSCGQSFTRAYTRNVHMKRHISTSKIRKSFKCSAAGCGERFTRKHDRLRHEASLHNRSTGFQCEICSRHFSSSFTFQKHLTYKHPNNEPPSSVNPGGTSP